MHGMQSNCLSVTPSITMWPCRFFAVAFGFAFALFVSLICFNHISANMNPASVLGKRPHSQSLRPQKDIRLPNAEALTSREDLRQSIFLQGQ